MPASTEASPIVLRSRTRLASVALTLFVGACGSRDEIPPDPDTGADVDVGDVDTDAPDTGAEVDSTIDAVADTAVDDDAADSGTTEMDAGCETGATATCYFGPDGTEGVGICRAGVAICTDGAFGACVGEVLPATETCNGLDDDCDGSSDDGCPASTALGAPTSTLLGYGSAVGGTEAIDTCPVGSAVVGINVVVRDYLRQIQGICAPIQVVETTTVTPYDYSITTGPAVTMTNRGNASGTAVTARCPVGTFVVGARSQAGALVDQLTLRCAPLHVTGTVGAFTVARGTVTELAPVGGTGGSPRDPSTCAGVGVVDGILSRTGSGEGSGVDFVQLSCATPTLLPKP